MDNITKPDFVYVPVDLDLTVAVAMACLVQTFVSFLCMFSYCGTIYQVAEQFTCIRQILLEVLKFYEFFAITFAEL